MPVAFPRAAIDMPDALNRESFTISDLSEEFQVTARALRFYEDEGLIAPRRVGLSRVYSPNDRARLAWILRAKRVGFSLADIREMIALYALDDNRAAGCNDIAARCRARIDFLKRQREDVDAAIAELADFVAHIDPARP